MFSYPLKLLHLDRSRGGLGLPSFSYLAESRKLQKLFFCMRSSQQHGLAARGLLSRAARKYGYFSSPGQRLVIIPLAFTTTTQHLYCDGPISMLADYGLYLCRHGTTTTADNPSHPLLQLISTEDDDSLHTSLMNGLFTIGDCVEFKNGNLTWYLPDTLPCFGHYSRRLQLSSRRPCLQVNFGNPSLSWLDSNGE